MIPNANIYTDFAGLTKLRADVSNDANSQKNLREVAGQFEALFTQLVLKSMREAKLSDGLYDSDQEQQYLEMFDAQLALDLSKGSGLGLADMLVRQLAHGAGALAQDKANPGGVAEGASGPGAAQKWPGNGGAPTYCSQSQGCDVPGADSETNGLGRSPQAFVETLWPYARKAANSLGVAPRTLLAQAALETGWGKSVPCHPDGRSSHNVFGIKAETDWQGERVTVPTIEHENGVAVRRSSAFRSYASLEESFADYVRLLANDPRYRAAVEKTDDSATFAQALQQAGYATDPAYAQKIGAVLSGKTLDAAAAGLKVSSNGPLT